MHVSIWGWGSLILLLWTSTFGIWWTFVAIFALIIFIIGGLSFLYITNKELTYMLYLYITSDNTTVLKPGLRRIVDHVSSPGQPLKCDKRLTGAHVIDERLQEIIGYLIRDYVYPWYDSVSDNEEFIYQLRTTGQKALVSIASRMKEVEWIPYLTTRLVDDAASHLRLYRQACAKVKLKQEEKMVETKQKSVGVSESNKPQTLADFKNTTEQNETKTHSRNSSTGNSGIQTQTMNKSPTHSRTNSNTKNEVKKTKNEETYKSYLQDNNKGTKNSEQPNFKCYVQDCEETSTKDEIEKIFFDLETNMENNLLCRDNVSCDKEDLERYLQDVVQIILFLVLSPDDFHCLLFNLFVRDLLIGGIILPLINILSDPDYINLTIIWLCRDLPLSSEMFLLTLRVTDNVDELISTKELVSREISYLRSRDAGGENDGLIKQQLTSLFYVNKLLDTKLNRLQQGLDTDSTGLISELLLSHQGTKLVQLSLEVVLKNNIALSYFIDYMSTVGQQHYLFFYLNIEGWKVSVEQLLSDIEIQKMKQNVGDTISGDSLYNKTSLSEWSVGGKRTTHHFTTSGRSPTRSNSNDSTMNNMREAAVSIFQQYLSEKSNPRVRLDDKLVERLRSRLSQDVSETWFDEVQAALYEKLRTNEKFLPGFHQSSNYIKLLSELELLQGSLTEEFDEDGQSLDNVSLSDDVSVSSLDTHEYVEEPGSASRVSTTSEPVILEPVGTFKLTAEIIETGLVQDRGNTYGIYALIVCKSYENGFVEKWHVYRRYSDFYDLQQRIKETYSNLGKLTFPGKKTFHNMERSTLEKRMKMLNDYLQILIHLAGAGDHPKLSDMLLGFLEEGEYDKSGGLFAKTFESLVTPIKSSMRTVGQAVRTMPDNLMNTVDEVFDGITKVFSTRNKNYEDPMRVGAAIQQETADNIPLRIMLLLMDEVFDLKSRNQWLRRRIVIVLRHFIRTMVGDIVNKKIIDYVAELTSPEQVADYLTAFKNSMWPNGSKPVPPATRDEHTKMRTRVMAKTVLLSSLSDELKHIIGSDTTRRGLLRVFHLLQHSVLNKRLIFVLLEGILQTLFPQHRLDQVFQKIHSRSSRVKEEVKSSKKTKCDLRR